MDASVRAMGVDELQAVITSALPSDLSSSLLDTSRAIPEGPARLGWLRHLVSSLVDGDPEGLCAFEQRFRFWPVGVREFIESPYFMNAKGTIYPEILNCLEEMNSGDYEEAVLTGGIGTGKSTAALYSTAYQLYVLSCYKNPHATFKLDPSSEIVFIFQSINASLAKAVDFDRFRTMISKSQYFKDHFPYDEDITSELRFPNRVLVKPVTGSDTAAIGQNVIGGLIDEMNFMAMVENSKSSIDGGSYDQAMALYDSIARRRKSRFMTGGSMPGLLCLVSSKRYPGQFTDVKEQEAIRELERTGKTSIYIFDKRAWDVKPAGSFTGVWFQVFTGDESRKPRIIEDGDEIPVSDVDLIVDIPEEYRSEFEKDILGSLRDIAGVSTLAKHPFIVQRESVMNAMRKGPTILSRDRVDFVTTKLGIYPDRFVNPQLPRFVHCDLALTGDSAGLVVGTVTGFKAVEAHGTVEILPVIWIDAVLEVVPPKGGEILFYKLRDTINALRANGMNIRWVTYDSFQSADSMQLMKQAGYIVGYQSMDTTTAPYELLKNALYDGRISIPDNDRLKRELVSLEKDTKKNKIDHPPHGSKDIADALAGVAYGVTTRRELWAIHGVPLGQVPASISTVLKQKTIEDAKKNAGIHA